MMDVEPLIDSSFDRLYPVSAPVRSWDDVLSRAGVPVARSRSHRRRVAVAIVAAAVLAVLAATPLGATIGQALWNFPAWLTGEPGKPASPSAQKAFADENARSWTAFPKATKLRELIRMRQDGVEYALYGFRSGDMFCLRLVVSRATSGKAAACAPVSDLRSRLQPALAIQVDDGFGTIPGKHVRIGIDTYTLARASASFGIVADAVRAVTLRSDDRTRSARVAGNAFLSVATRPKTGARVTRITATVKGGRTYVLPFAQAPFDSGNNVSVPNGTLHGPSRIQRVVRGGSIGWLDRREPRGEPLPNRFPGFLGAVDARRVFGRLIRPDPENTMRVSVTLYRVLKASRERFMKPGPVVCFGLVVGRTTGGGCDPQAMLFVRGRFAFSTSTLLGGDQYSIIDGVASDEVAALRIFLGDGGVLKVPLRDNAFVSPVSRARYPIRLVAYDSQGQVIGIQSMQGEGATPEWQKPDPRSHWRLVKRIKDAGGKPATLFTRRSLTGGVCFSFRTAGGSMGGCRPPTWQGPVLQLGLAGDPRQQASVLEGNVRPDVTRIEIRHRSGNVQTAQPIDGLVLEAVSHGDRVVEVDGYNSAGGHVGHYTARN